MVLGDFGSLFFEPRLVPFDQDLPRMWTMRCCWIHRTPSTCWLRIHMPIKRWISGQGRFFDVSHCKKTSQKPQHSGIHQPKDNLSDGSPSSSSGTWRPGLVFFVAGRWTLYAPRWVNWRRRTPNWRTGGAQVGVRHPQSRRHRRHRLGYLGYLGLSGIGCWTTYIYCFTPMIKPDWLRLLIDTYRFYIDMYCFQDQLKAPARRCLMAIHMCLIHWYET